MKTVLNILTWIAFLWLGIVLLGDTRNRGYVEGYEAAIKDNIELLRAWEHSK